MISGALVVVPLGRGGSALPVAAALTLARTAEAAGRDGAEERIFPLVDLSAADAPRDTLLASTAARSTAALLGAELPRLRTASRGHLCLVGPEPGRPVEDALDGMGELEACADAVIACGPDGLWAVLERLGAAATAVVGVVDGEDTALQALLAIDVVRRGLVVKLWRRRPGWLQARRALAGIEPGGASSAAARAILGGLAAGAARREVIER